MKKFTSVLWSTMRRSKVASGSLLFTWGSKIIIKTNTHQCQRQQRCTAQHAQASSWVEWIFSDLLCLKDKLDTTNRDENKITLSECVRIHHKLLIVYYSPSHSPTRLATYMFIIINNVVIYNFIIIYYI